MMKRLALGILLGTAPCLLVPSQAQAQDEPTATAAAAEVPADDEDVDAAVEALWEEVEAAIDGLQNPVLQPRSREEAVSLFREGIEAFDKAYAAFIKDVPTDSRRWIARLFAAKIAASRPLVGLEEAGTLLEILDEILEADDAAAEVKSEASAAQLIETANTAKESEATRKAWKEKLARHLKKYPSEALNGDAEAAGALLDPLELEFTDVKGEEFDLSKLRGKVVLIDFWATWCEPCVAELPNVLAAYEELHPKGFEIVGISLDQKKEDLENFIKERKMPWVQYYDGRGWENEISTRFGITAIPAMWLLNKKGMVVDMQASANLEVKVKQLLEEE